MTEELKAKLKGVCCVEVSGESCANCLTLMPILDRLISERKDVKLVHVEADYTTTALMEEWDVTKVPTILLMEDAQFCRSYLDDLRSSNFASNQSSKISSG